MFDALIIGCGITGAAAAFTLSKYRLKVGVLERENDVANGTTKANSAILHAGYDPEPGTLMARLNVRGSALAKELCEKLDVPCRQCGSLVLAFGEEDERTLQALYEQGLANGVPGQQILTGDEARELDGGVSPEATAALYAPTAAICSPWEYCLALAETAVKNGAELHRNTAVTGLERRGEAWLVHTDRGDFEGRFVLNAAGVHAAQIHDMAAPHSFHILPSKGEYHLLDKAEGGRVSHVIFQCPSKEGKGVLVAPTVHGNLIAGPSSAASEGEDVTTTAEGLDLVRRSALRSVPGVDFRQTIRTFAGVRARTAKEDFIIEEAAPGFIDLAGICSPGLSAAPAIAEYAVELLEKAGLVLEEKADFLCERKRIRFKELPPEEKAALVEKDPAYGRVICRCETITEGEILAALRSPIPPRSIDAVKRRVNAGMGRCQGGFCAPRVAELLCRELGLTPGEVLQDREGTWLLSHETKGGSADV